MPVAVFPIGPLETNAYVISAGQDAVVVDPGGDIRGGLSRITEYLAEKKLTLKAILVTHLHFDHILGVAQLVEAFPEVSVYASENDDNILQPCFGGGGGWGMPQVRPFVYQNLTEGEHAFGTVALRVISTPGHSEGSVSLYVPAENSVFVGDLLFYRSVGRTDLPGSVHQKLVDSLKEKIYTLPADTTAYPGHGPKTRIGDEKTQNPFVRA